MRTVRVVVVLATGGEITNELDEELVEEEDDDEVDVEGIEERSGLSEPVDEAGDVEHGGPNS